MKKHLPLAAGILLAFASVCFAQPQATTAPAPKPKPAMSKAQMLKVLSTAEKKLWDAFKNKDPKRFRARRARHSKEGRHRENDSDRALRD